MLGWWLSKESISLRLCSVGWKKSHGVFPRKLRSRGNIWTTYHSDFPRSWVLSPAAVVGLNDDRSCVPIWGPISVTMEWATGCVYVEKQMHEWIYAWMCECMQIVCINICIFACRMTHPSIHPSIHIFTVLAKYKLLPIQKIVYWQGHSNVLQILRIYWWLQR